MDGHGERLLLPLLSPKEEMFTNAYVRGKRTVKS